MSRVYLIAADKPLPLCDKQAERQSTVTVGGKTMTISFVRGFHVSAHSYYRSAVDVLGYPMKPYQYELEMEVHRDDLSHFQDYLLENFQSGEFVELWNIWVGIDQSGRVPHYSGHLRDFDMETLKQFLDPGPENGAPGQCRMTIMI